MAMDWKYAFSNLVTGSLTGMGLGAIGGKSRGSSTTEAVLFGGFLGAVIGGLSSVVTYKIFGPAQMATEGIQGVWPESRFSQRTLKYRRLVR